ncbi:MAG: translation initiation factor IF-2 [Candidatus Asgardarchaeia archaeon]
MCAEKTTSSETYKRSPIVTFLGHIDVGKTSLLDKIRGTAVQKKEAGGITQHIGASFFPIETIKSICGPLLKSLKVKLTLPGLLIIDTPGHEVFANLRKRGGSVSDIAVLVVDIAKGFQAQTYEVIEILKARRIPFIVAANKLDRLPGWQKHPDKPFILSFKEQPEPVKQKLDEYIYKLMGEFSQEGFRADRYDRIRDFTKTVAIIPTSAVTGEGIPDLLMVLVGLTQQYMSKRLIAKKGPGAGVVLEVKDEIGLGRTLDVILYDGVLRKGDTIIVGGLEKPIISKIRSLLIPKPLDEIRAPREKFKAIDEVHAAAGVKIVAPNLEDAVAGAPLRAVWNQSNLDEVVNEVMQEVQRIRISTDKVGVILKADTLGTLEALTEYLSRFKVPIRIADVGDVSKRDVVEAAAVKENNRYYGVILAFNVKILPDAEEKAKELGVKIFWNNIIYNLFDEYDRWVKEQKEAEIKKKLSAVIRPGKIKVLPGYIFRSSKPAIVGVEVLGGVIKPHYKLIDKNADVIGEILQIQDRGKNINEAKSGQAVAISIRGAVAGRDFDEGDELYVLVPKDHIKILKRELKEELSPDELSVLDEIIEILKKKERFVLG